MEVFWNPYILLIIAFLIILFEFFMPGGIVGIIGGIVILFSLVAFFSKGYGPVYDVLYVFFIGIILYFLVKFILQAIRKTGPKNTIMLDKNQEGYVASHYDKHLIGKTGVAGTDLKPAGKVIVDGKEVQALSELGYISRGKQIKVIGGQGAHVIVREVR